jgi:hypothetical protein
MGLFREWLEERKAEWTRPLTRKEIVLSIVLIIAFIISVLVWGEKGPVCLAGILLLGALALGAIALFLGIIAIIYKLLGG